MNNPQDDTERVQRLELLATRIRKKYGRGVLRSCGLDDVSGRGIVPIGNLVPQVGQTPWVAGLPFLNVTCFGLDISRLLRHLKQ